LGITAIYASADLGTHPILFLGNFGMLEGTANAANYFIVQPTDIEGEITPIGIPEIINIIAYDQPVHRINNNFHIVAQCYANFIATEIKASMGVTIEIDGFAVGEISELHLPNFGENIFRITLSTPGCIHGCNVYQHYTLTINKPIPFEQVVVMRWDNTLAVINNPDQNGGFSFTSYRWFRNGTELIEYTNRQWYSAGPTDGFPLNSSDEWRVEFTANNIQSPLRSCETRVTLQPHVPTLKAYPNPVFAGTQLWFETDADDSLLEGAKIEVFNINGLRVDTIPLQGNRTAINSSRYAPGVYILVLTGRNEFRQEVKITVK
jgi:hypothetical protein